MVDRFHSLGGFEQASFTIYHTDTFDYSQANPSATEDAVAQLARILDAEPFQANLGLIGMPNSQGNALFLNCLLAHEIGEYAYAKRAIDSVLYPEVRVALDKSMGNDFNKQPIQVQSRMINTVLQWAKEIFCDLFAVRLVGPCYTFAYIELFDLGNLVGRESDLIADDEARPQILSYRKYPSHPFRVKTQVELLKYEGWWSFIEDIDSRSVQVLKNLVELKFSTFIEAEEESPDGRAPFLVALLAIMPEIQQHLGKITQGLDPGLHEYSIVWKSIASYLGNGIVPSTLNIEVEKGRFEKVNPTSIALLNASYRFYLEGLEGLMDKISNQDTTSARERTNWTVTNRALGY